MSRERGVLIVGAGGLGIEVLSVLRSSMRAGPTVYGFADDERRAVGALVGGLPVEWTVEEALHEFDPSDVVVHLAIGSNDARKAIAERFSVRGFGFVTIRHDTCYIGEGAVLGTGCYLAPFVIVSPTVSIGDHVILNSHAAIGHHSCVESFSQIGPGARLSGHCRLGQGALLGSNAVLAPGVQVGAEAVVGACSFAVRNVAAGETVIGVPAKRLLSRPAREP